MQGVKKYRKTKRVGYMKIMYILEISIYLMNECFMVFYVKLWLFKTVNCPN